MISGDTKRTETILECLNSRCPVFKYHTYIRPSPFAIDYEEARRTGDPIKTIEVKGCPSCIQEGV